MGLFITFEGADATGKSTQVKLLAEALKNRGMEYVLTREPGGTPTAERIRDLVLDPGLHVGDQAELLLYLAARAEHVQKLIKPALDADKFVICDRFMDSTLAYQAIARGLGLTEVLAINAFAMDGLVPDITFLLNADSSVIEERSKFRGLIPDRLEAEDNDFKERVRRGFLQIQQLYPERIKLIDAARSIEDVHADIVDHMRKVCPAWG